jgi:hypothetical protein
MITATTLILVLLLVSLLSVSLAQPAQPAQVELRKVGMTITMPQGWRLGNQTPDSVALHVPPKRERQSPGKIDQTDVKPDFVVAAEAGMLITTERRRDHSEALRRLAEIASEYPEPATTRVINGWPAIERRYRSVMPQPGVQQSRGNTETLFLTTAIAAGVDVIRFETMFAPDADTKLFEDALSIARNYRGPQGRGDVSQRELPEIQRMIKPPRTAPAPRPGRTGGDGRRPGPRKGGSGVAVNVQSGRGELEVASNDGQNVVVAANSGFSFSSNFGATYTFGGGTPCNQTTCDGDPSLAVGNSGNFYYAWIGGPSSSQLGDGVSRSTNNGQTFTFRGMAATCPGTTTCTVADQEHIAADRVNPGASGDRIYNVWRDFAPSFSIRISCSSDSGATWTAGTAIGAGDLPRVSVGGDGFVYVAWANGGNMMLHKFSNCDAGLTPQVGWPVTVSAFTNVACPVPGLDRCNGRNILSSPKVAVDDLDPQHIYYAFATNTAAGNEDVMVFDSVNGGATFPRSVRVNSAVAGRRFMPWVSSYGGIAVVSWYDRRNATTTNDQTRFFIGGAAVKGPNLVALTETDLSGNDDNQCSTWPCATNATTDSEGCTVQPQLGGRCLNAMNTGSGTPCDFSSTACPTGETCKIGRGCPKYGDYNGNAVGLGRHYSAWSSALPPVAIGGAAGSIKVYASTDRIPSDFYVRDWNATATVFDNGQQPSTQANFWSTSDVWNQSVNVPGAPGPDGSVLGDPPSRTGSNFLFARVSRRAAAMSTAPPTSVTANFLFGDFGLGAAFVPIGSETVNFAAADMANITPPHSWSVPSGASLHLCIAVELNGPDGDTLASPSVAGTAPGPADPLIIIDNNKAQRNLQDTIGTEGGTELIAVIRNSERIARPMRLRIMLPPDTRAKGVVDVIGGQSVELANNGAIFVGELKPGEARWVRFRITSLAGIDKPTPVSVFEDSKDRPSNGFTVLLHRRRFEEVAQRNMLAFASVLTRLAQLENNGVAKELAATTVDASRRLNKDSYAEYFKAYRPRIKEIVDTHIRSTSRTDPFGLASALDDLAKALDGKNMDAVTLAQIEIAERLDAHLSMLVRQRKFPNVR